MWSSVEQNLLTVHVSCSFLLYSHDCYAPRRQQPAGQPRLTHTWDGQHNRTPPSHSDEYLLHGLLGILDLEEVFVWREDSRCTVVLSAHALFEFELNSIAGKGYWDGGRDFNYTQHRPHRAHLH